LDNLGIIKKPRGPRPSVSRTRRRLDHADRPQTSTATTMPHPRLPRHRFPAPGFAAAPPFVHHLWPLYRAPTPHRGASFLPPPPVARYATISATVEPPRSTTPAPSELPVTAPSTAPPCTTFPHRELSTTNPGRRPHHRSLLADHTSPWSSSFW
jgi:hypothetical protein